jgi:hypothetical protein
MNPVKQLGLVALLMVGPALFVSTPAQAGKIALPDAGNWGTVQLTNVGDEPGASGEASLTDVRCLHEDPPLCLHSGTLTLKCQNLTPGATYLTAAGTLKPNRKANGEWEVTGKVLFLFDYLNWEPPYVVEVVRLDPDGSSTTVLTGYFFPPVW